MTTSAPKPPVSDAMASTGSWLRLFTVWVAPSPVAHWSFWSSRSTAMIVPAPARRAPATPAAPPPPPPPRAPASPSDHRDALAATDVAGVDGRSEPRHHAAAEETHGGRACGRVDLGAL